MRSYDAIVLGAGHNGLVAGALLARAGYQTLIVEAASVAGGAARTVEFAPGFKVSHVAHLLTHLDGRVVDQLGLVSHGLELLPNDLATIALSLDERPLRIDGHTLAGVVKREEQVAWQALYDRLLRFAATLRPFMHEVPPELGRSTKTSGFKLARLGLAIRNLGRDEMREFLRLVLMPIADVLEDELSDPRLMGAVAFDATLGTHLGPRSPGSVLTLLYRLSGEIAGHLGRVAMAKGGMGALTASLARAATAAGAEIRLLSKVEQIIVDSDRVTGLRLASGEEFITPLVVSAANPRTTLLDMVGPRYLGTGTIRRVNAIRMRGNAAKLHLALLGSPNWRGLAPASENSRLIIAPSIDAIEGAFNAAKYGEASADPVMEIVVPTLSDPSLAPQGKHVLSAIVQYAPYDVKGGWESNRAAFTETAIGVLERYAPGIRHLIVAAELVTPYDLESRYLMLGGHWHHGEMSVDQMFMLRPFQEAAQYRTSVDGLFLAGAGSHPGGNIMGLSAMNCVAAIRKGRGK